jgi:hypothetical protein
MLAGNKRGCDGGLDPMGWWERSSPERASSGEVLSGVEEIGGEADTRSLVQGFGSKGNYGSQGSLWGDQRGLERTGGGQCHLARAVEASIQEKLPPQVISRWLELEEAITSRGEDGGPISKLGR